VIGFDRTLFKKKKKKRKAGDAIAKYDGYNNTDYRREDKKLH
jgi:hypothetical protein